MHDLLLLYSANMSSTNEFASGQNWYPKGRKDRKFKQTEIEHMVTYSCSREYLRPFGIRRAAVSANVVFTALQQLL